jgi:hypothetical protein
MFAEFLNNLPNRNAPKKNACLATCDRQTAKSNPQISHSSQTNIIKIKIKQQPSPP